VTAVTSAATTTRTTTAPATTTSEAASTAATALATCSLAGDINNDLTTLYLGAIEHINCRLGLFWRRHLDKSKSALPTGCGVKHYAR
jgi:hypothetical protein